MKIYDLFGSLKFAVCRSRFDGIAEDYTTKFFAEKKWNKFRANKFQSITNSLKIKLGIKINSIQHIFWQMCHFQSTEIFQVSGLVFREEMSKFSFCKAFFTGCAYCAPTVNKK